MCVNGWTLWIKYMHHFIWHSNGGPRDTSSPQCNFASFLDQKNNLCCTPLSCSVMATGHQSKPTPLTNTRRVPGHKDSDNFLRYTETRQASNSMRNTLPCTQPHTTATHPTPTHLFSFWFTQASIHRCRLVWANSFSFVSTGGDEAALWAWPVSTKALQGFPQCSLQSTWGMACQGWTLDLSHCFLSSPIVSFPHSPASHTNDAPWWSLFLPPTGFFALPFFVRSYLNIDLQRQCLVHMLVRRT